jgi:predicted GIY-YIG superfamily endonuclease
MFYVYILRCSDGSYYVGHSEDVSTRLKVHNAGEGAAWTARRRPVILVYQEPLTTETEAVERELQLKGWSRAKKEALIKGNRATLKQLSECRSS